MDVFCDVFSEQVFDLFGFDDDFDGKFNDLALKPWSP